MQQFQDCRKLDVVPGADDFRERTGIPKFPRWFDRGQFLKYYDAGITHKGIEADSDYARHKTYQWRPLVFRMSPTHNDTTSQGKYLCRFLLPYLVGGSVTQPEERRMDPVMFLSSLLLRLRNIGYCNITYARRSTTQKCWHPRLLVTTYEAYLLRLLPKLSKAERPWHHWISMQLWVRKFSMSHEAGTKLPFSMLPSLRQASSNRFPY